MGSPYKGNGDSVVRNTAMLWASVIVLCLKHGVSCFFVLKFEVCVVKLKLWIPVLLRHITERNEGNKVGTKKINKATKGREKWIVTKKNTKDI